MIKKRQMSRRTVAELVAHLGRTAHGEGFVGGLTPAQWTALRYFSGANRFSRAPSAFAEYHGTTRGTASQTIKSLVSQGYLIRRRSEADGRSAQLDLTDKAKTILADDPFMALMRAASALSPAARRHLADVLERLLGHVALEHGKCPFGMCISCEHLKGDGCCREGKPPYECGFLDEPLDEAELEQLCINYEPGKASAMKHAVSRAAQR
jgi:DNA-binding MarR family transcriptional regulator